jgi:hypothetical protein
MESASPKPEPRIITGQYIEKKGTQVIIKEDDGVNHVYPADLDVIKILSSSTSPVKSGDRVSVMLVKVADKEVVHKIGPGALGEQFRTGKEILQENIDSMHTKPAAAAKTLPESIPDIPSLCRGCEAVHDCPKLDPKAGCLLEVKALIQKAKEDAEGDQRIKENAEHAAALAKQATEAPKPAVPAQSPKEPEKVPQNEAVAVPHTLVKSSPALKNAVPAMQPEDALIPEPEDSMAGPVELGVHLDMGSYTNFDLKVSELTGDRAIARLEKDAMKTISMMRRLMSAAKKGY